MFRCVNYHQCNAERSGAEMEERSREHFTMFRCRLPTTSDYNAGDFINPVKSLSCVISLIVITMLF